jgi:hypothetical protein
MSASQITAATRQIISERSGGWCEVCRDERATDLHHRRRKGMGGVRGPSLHLPVNLLHVCRFDHQFIHANPETAMDSGWMLRVHEAPEETPARLHTIWGPYLTWLEDDGCYRVEFDKPNGDAR